MLFSTKCKHGTKKKWTIIFSAVCETPKGLETICVMVVAFWVMTRNKERDMVPDRWRATLGKRLISCCSGNSCRDVGPLGCCRRREKRLSARLLECNVIFTTCSPRDGNFQLFRRSLEEASPSFSKLLIQAPIQANFAKTGVEGCESSDEGSSKACSERITVKSTPGTKK